MFQSSVYHTDYLFCLSKRKIKNYPAGIHLLKVNNGNRRTMCENCFRITIKAPERRYWCRSSIVIVNFKQISHIVLVFPLLTLNSNCWLGKSCNCLNFIDLIFKTFQNNKAIARGKFLRSYKHIVFSCSVASSDIIFLPSDIGFRIITSWVYFLGDLY